ncbi:kinesin-domain-containing protein [Guyanagaster necrorhizus]|uniref:Kinesin-like protein n=1 Tax=Guyanagaster necrorhizus TaxID=856835 RepID=A0A9P8AWF8_9AGAR|nr:kinesin-domain-containing protein [Guyanagaster necrorhizus MCA 3950]KAG7450141.1 kinesin-domain-containing protein [Guyanagaster necrorhizus MCA 3950]
MSDRAKQPTRASTRTKTATLVPPTTRSTRSKTTMTTATAKAATATEPIVKKTTRKPLVAKGDNATSATKPPSKLESLRKVKDEPCVEQEPIMAYLRIRPHLSDDEASTPYLTCLSDTTVRMTDLNDQQNRYRASVMPLSTYTFSRVFTPDTSQSDFFQSTTLPLVRDALQGQNALLFAYGATNSGKTYTIQGGSQDGSAGILPRSLDVLFNSTEGLRGQTKYRPVRLQGVELSDAQDTAALTLHPEPSVAEVLGHPVDTSFDTDIDPTVLNLDRNYEYSIWLSYAEVYNEKIYDLLDSVKGESATQPLPHSGNTKALLLTRKALTLKTSPPSDNAHSDIRGKYISGLRQFRVDTAAQAKALVKLGQLHRRVFGTLANAESSRSHGVVMIKIMRGHRGEKNDPTSLQISRLTLVDLAGSERIKHTHTTGDRLKEAGNINKSLMVLGQCLEVLRSNQRKVAMSLGQEGVGTQARMDTRDVKKTLSIVPFRHSKLTETLMDYFVGDGRTVMIVNVNPFDTGYDENSHVMKFAALAREVYVTPAPAPVKQIPSMLNIVPGKSTGNIIKQLGPLTMRNPDIVPKPMRRKVTISTGGAGSGKNMKDAVLEVLEVDEAERSDNGDDDDEYPANPLVDALFEEIDHLRLQLYEAELRCADIEADTREEVMAEMEERMRMVENTYERRLRNEIDQNNLKTDAKIDMLHQAGLFSPVKQDRLPPVSRTQLRDNTDGVDLTLPNEDSDLTSLDGDESDPDSFRPKSPSAKGWSNSSTVAAEQKTTKPKKRLLGKNPVVTEEQIDMVTAATERRIASGEYGQPHRFAGR